MNLVVGGTNPNHPVHHCRILNSIKTIQKKIKIVTVGDQTRVTHVTGGNTHQYTIGFYVLKLKVCKQKHILFSIKLLLLFIQ